MFRQLSLNSVTNLLHALALGTYSWLVYVHLAAGEPHYTLPILYTFVLVFVLKVLGVLVHVHYVEARRHLSDALWSAIAVGVCLLNYAVLVATHMDPLVIAVSMAVTAVCCILFVHSLRTNIKYLYIAGAASFVYLVAAVLTCGELRIGLILIVLSNIAWIMLEKVPYLYDRRYHNDIYHVALIISTFVLYHSVATGLWFGTSCH